MKKSVSRRSFFGYLPGLVAFLAATFFSRNSYADCVKCYYKCSRCGRSWYKKNTSGGYVGCADKIRCPKCGGTAYYKRSERCSSSGGSSGGSINDTMKKLLDF